MPARKLLTYSALLVLGGLLTPIALGFAAPRMPKLPKGQAPRVISTAELAAADALDKVPSSTVGEKVATLKALGVRVPSGQLGEPFVLSPRQPFIDGSTWLGLTSADVSAGKNMALVLPMMGYADLHLVPKVDKTHLVECYVDMLGNPWIAFARATSQGDVLAASFTPAIDNRVSFVIPPQKKVRPVVVSLTAGEADDEMAIKAFDPRRFMLRSCEITPVG